jgi:predicted DNA-binding protein (MmcQ/YjbR family)
MNVEDIREYCLTRPDVEESLPFGPDVVVFKTKGKIFLLLPLYTEEVRFNVKCDTELAIELRETYDCVLPGYHMNKKHWNTIVSDGSVKRSKLIEWIDLSYDLISGKKKR